MIAATGGRDGQIGVCRGETLGNRHSGERLGKIEEEGDQPKAFGARARYVRGANVAATGLPDVLVAEDADEKIAERNGTEQVGKRYGDKPGIHALGFKCNG